MVVKNHLKDLEADSIHIIRETVASFKNPVMLYSIGKDSSVLLHLIRKAFFPGKIPFPLLHIDTGFKFQEMIKFRSKIKKELALDLIVYKNESEQAMSFKPDEANTDEYIYHKKTKALLDALKEHDFDVAFGGARRDEEKSRAKERIFSHRNANGVWDPKNQRPELWSLYNTKIKKGETMRVFPLSNWTELDIWNYIKQENIKIVPLYFAEKRRMLIRNGVLVRVDEFNIPKKGEKIIKDWSRFRTLGCSPSTGAVLSKATNLDEIIEEIRLTHFSERQTRAIDNSSSMEYKKKQGYF
ncbi:MAG: sulfate adenylyltransferase subunit CysD [Candidatus Paceibacterota bacterium]